ncbi:MAG: cytochrome ubiquinol oxidase subunit I [Acidobacteria bacterium]|nr:cytochrome ubiquinol oxidase subunit I [Acidobacteriota bacterium]
MDTLLLARLQFGITSVYHFFFVPLTLGLSLFVAFVETLYWRTGDETYKRMAKFWGKLFLINFAMGVVTGILQEFQFGMNWSEYSRFMGDIFGAPLAIEALVAFYLESVFLGVWIFGWDKLSRGAHAIVAWLFAIGSNLSAFWILVANSFMQEPVGYAIRNGRAEMTDFLALITNPHVWVQFPHVITAGMATGAFFVIGIAAWHLMRKTVDVEPFRRSMRIALVYAGVSVALTVLIGHNQAQHMTQAQPMKMAAAEALWESENPASFSVFTWGNEAELRDVWALRVPGFLSFLAYNRFDGEVQGIKNIQAEYEQRFGPGDYIPPVAVSYWSFRFMVGAGFAMLGIVIVAAFLAARGKLEQNSWMLKLLFAAIALPYIGNSAGWIFTEVGRMPWIVFGLQRVEDGVSPAVSAGELLFSLVAFTALYGALMVADVYLLSKFAKRGMVSAAGH